jgi:hypothetical protein
MLGVIAALALAPLSFVFGAIWALQKRDETGTATFYVTKSCKIGVKVDVGSGLLKSSMDIVVSEAASVRIANAVLDQDTKAAPGDSGQAEP